MKSPVPIWFFSLLDNLLFLSTNLKLFFFHLEFRGFVLRCMFFLFVSSCGLSACKLRPFFRSAKYSSVFKLLPLLHLCLFFLLELIYLTVRTTGSIFHVSYFPHHFHLFMLFALCFEIFFPHVLPSHYLSLGSNQTSLFQYIYWFFFLVENNGF